MKKYIFFVLSLFFLLTIQVSAQTANSCATVTSTNQSTCCTGVAYYTNSTACNNYRDATATFGNFNTTNQTTTTPNTNSTPPPTSVNQNQCAKPNSTNYQYCCNSMRFANLDACMIYEASIRGTITGGALPSNTINGNSPQQNAAAGQSQSSSSQLKECSAIKFSSLLDILIWAKCIIVIAIIPLIFALATLFFMWGVMKFIMASDSTKKEEGKKFIMAGLIGLFVMTSLWGIIKIVSNALGTGSAVPVLQTSSLMKTP